MTDKFYIINSFKNINIKFWLGAFIGFILIVFSQILLNKLLDNKIKNNKTQNFFKTIINWIFLFLLVIFLLNYFAKSSFLYRSLFMIGDTKITLFLLLIIVFSILLAVKFSKAIREFILPIFYNRYDVDIGLRAAINTFINYLILTTTVIISLSSIGFNLNSLTVFASVLGVGIGFGLKNVMSNFISGLIILFERPIKVGDRILIEDKLANVEEIKIRATIVRTRANERMIIPNSYFLEEKFINRSYEDQRLRVSVSVDVAYDSDLELVNQILKESVYELKNETWPEILNEPQPRVFFEEFGDSGLHFSVWFWINSQSDEKEFLIPSDLRFKINEKFRENEIEMPFPQQDIHLIKK